MKPSVALRIAGSKKILPVQRADGVLRRRQHGDRARDAGGEPTAHRFDERQWLAVLIEEHAGACGSGGFLASVPRGHVAAVRVVVEEKCAAAHTGALRLHQPEHRLHGDRRDHGVAAARENRKSRLDGQRVGGGHPGLLAGVAVSGETTTAAAAPGLPARAFRAARRGRHRRCGRRGFDRRGFDRRGRRCRCGGGCRLSGRRRRVSRGCGRHGGRHGGRQPQGDSSQRRAVPRAPCRCAAAARSCQVVCKSGAHGGRIVGSVAHFHRGDLARGRAYPQPGHERVPPPLPPRTPAVRRGRRADCARSRECRSSWARRAAVAR